MRDADEDFATKNKRQLLIVSAIRSSVEPLTRLEVVGRTESDDEEADYSQVVSEGPQTSRGNRKAAFAKIFANLWRVR
jgi:hypothetical protein